MIRDLKNRLVSRRAEMSVIKPGAAGFQKPMIMDFGRARKKSRNTKIVCIHQLGFAGRFSSN